MKHLFLFIALLVSYTLNAQTTKEDIRKTYDNYMPFVKTLNVDSTLNYIYPKLFEIVPRAVLLESMDESFSDTSIQMSFANDNIISISDIQTFDSIHYAMIDYSYTMKMRYMNEEDYTITEDSVDVFGFTQQFLEAQYGEENIVTDTTLHEFRIFMEAQMYAIYDPTYKSWKFLENKPELANIIKMILSEEAISFFNKKE